MKKSNIEGGNAMKKFTVVVIALFLSFLAFASGAGAEEPNELAENEAVLYYMYSKGDSMYFLEPTAEYENVIYIGKHDFDNMPKKLHHGQKIIGVFVDSEKWELEAIREYKYK